MSVTIKSRIVSDVVILDVAGRFDIGEDSLRHSVKALPAEGGQHFLLNLEGVPYLGSWSITDNRRLDRDSGRKRHDRIGCAGKGSPGRTPIHKARYGLCHLQRRSGSTAASFWIVWSLLTEFSSQSMQV